MRFVKLTIAKNPKKRFTIEFSDPQMIISFGDSNGETYIDHNDKIKRKNYIKRHIVNEEWDTVNAGSLSRYLLWGSSTDLRTNLLSYLNRYDIKHDFME
jgi:hypothetical protein